MKTHKITLNIDDEVLKEMRTAMILRRMSEQSSGISDAFMSKVLDSIDSGQEQVDVKFKNKRNQG